MKTLYLMRHAKSSWNFDDLTDQERPLNDRGRTDAPRMGQALAKRNIRLDLLVSSPAVRALSTAALVAKELEYAHNQIQVNDRIYRAEVPDLVDIVRQLPDAADSVLLVGHNPTITDFANVISPSPLNELPTAAIVCIKFDCASWAEIDRSNADFYFFDYPRNQPE
ncbi:SixA phosphatase family protein [Hymenobacter cellulosilyticus]|uniref:Histidine phosphatase family protein n=1 Tax=Hymenobacter cellulosilyticus TaxID=2932248 RepID=A0A8T9QD37_9BACT|nr:histidine phosphatase family protein [Hymenobacter cellulosilyticus]UOQ72753.1 histidine phosphatase family protein [Hymenobacter cellulosilyticus]